MEQNETQKQKKLPVIQRLDRLDLLLNYIELEKNIPATTAEINSECEPCKDLTTVLEEVPVKGSLIERVASLEQRVVKLTQELREERSESFGKLALNSCRCSLEEKLPSRRTTQIEDPNGVSTQDKELKGKEKQRQELDGKMRQMKGKRRINPNSRYRKWLSSVPTWC